MKYYIADTHFGDYKAVRQNKQELSSVKKYERELIRRWNSRVTHKDVVYILGDFSNCSPWHTKRLLRKLKGKKIIIRGNHDDYWIEKTKTHYKDVLLIVDRAFGKKYYVVVSHYPTIVWNKQYHGHCVHLYGHVHTNRTRSGTLKHSALKYLHGAYNVGCMLPYMNYYPRTLEEIMRANYPRRYY